MFLLIGLMGTRKLDQALGFVPLLGLAKKQGLLLLLLPLLLLLCRQLSSFEKKGAGDWDGVIR